MVTATIDIRYSCIPLPMEPDDTEVIEGEDLYDAKTKTGDWLQRFVRNIESGACVDFDIIYEEDGEYIDSDSCFYERGELQYG